MSYQYSVATAGVTPGLISLLMSTIRDLGMCQQEAGNTQQFTGHHPLK